jgi:hypothetical protein
MQIALSFNQVNFFSCHLHKPKIINSGSWDFFIIY